MKVAILHPDLGIGGAERLIVDAALGLQRRGHTVHIYTSHHDPNHCFEETRNGSLVVRCVQPPFPRSLRGKGHILFAHLRQLHLTFHLLSGASEYDIYLVDQLSTCIPFIRGLAHKRVVFYGHFPDKLLADGQFVEGQTGLNKKYNLKGLYRIPMDWLEEATTRQTDVLLVNSKFTARIFEIHFPSIRHSPRVVYPGVNIEAYENSLSLDHVNVGDVFSYRPTLVSLNRFERKKNAALAIEAFALVRQQLTTREKERGFHRLRLVLAGGFDPRVQDNIDTLAHLTHLCEAQSLTYSIIPPTTPLTSKALSTSEPDVTILLNFTQVQRTWLLTSPNTLALLYTPTNEHFGVVPVEGMISRLPVLACDTGGPTESIVDPDFSHEPAEARTGWLRPPEAATWSSAILDILHLSLEERDAIGRRARQRAETVFSLDATAKSIEDALKEAVSMGAVQGQFLPWIVTALSGLFAFAVALLYYLLL
ncbi:glycosyltransferase family 4 protein [Ramaria rubella]|nr:glycosyltransferase family 4 protein [Ramaria rubella]